MKNINLGIAKEDIKKNEIIAEINLLTGKVKWTKKIKLLPKASEKLMNHFLFPFGS